MVAAGLVVGGGAIIAAPIALTAIGFGSAGVVGGSIAAAWQASIGNVAAGSIFAACQSAGAVGISAATSAAIGSAGAAVGSGLSFLGFRKKREEENEKGDVIKSNDGSLVQKTSTVGQQLGMICGYTMGMVLLCMVAAILVNYWLSSGRQLPDIRNAQVKNNVWKIVQDVKVKIPGIDKKAKEFWNSNVARSDASSYGHCASVTTIVICSTTLLASII